MIRGKSGQPGAIAQDIFRELTTTRLRDNPPKTLIPQLGISQTAAHQEKTGFVRLPQPAADLFSGLSFSPGGNRAGVDYNEMGRVVILPVAGSQQPLPEYLALILVYLTAEGGDGEGWI